jgi:integrase
MNPRILTPEELVDIREKLKRANEHIHNLDTEITAFLREHPDKPVTDDEHKAEEELWKFYVQRGIPPRFSVIAGEIVHHLRSCHCRRGLGSNLYRLGVPDVVIQRILRHANVSTTTGYYIKTIADDVRGAMEKLENSIPKSELDTIRTLAAASSKPI